MKLLHKILLPLAALTALTLATPAQARWFHHHYFGIGWGAPYNYGYYDPYYGYPYYGYYGPVYGGYAFGGHGWGHGGYHGGRGHGGHHHR